jgi:copper chaperone NosL
MKTLYQNGARALFIALLSLGLAACGGEQEVARTFDPVAFHADDECHVCGMILEEHAGPKGQAVGEREVRKFCSVAEMFGWYLQPENQHRNLSLYVHDMRHGTWESPSDEHLIDAREAFYVHAPDLQGAMGMPLATFADQHVAEQFASEQGGRVLRFADIDQTLLQSAASAMHMHGHHAEHDDHHHGHMGH